MQNYLQYTTYFQKTEYLTGKQFSAILVAGQIVLNIKIFRKKEEL